MLLSEDHFLEVGPLQSRAEAWLLQQLEHAQAMREDNVVAVLFARPVSKVVDVLKEGWIVKVAILRQVCKRAGARLRVLGCARVGRVGGRTVQVLRVRQRLHKLEFRLPQVHSLRPGARAC